jgi:putative acetyltransferase
MAIRADFTVRDYRRDDLDGVIEVFQGAVRQVASHDYRPEQIEAWSAVDRDEWSEWRLTRPTFVAEAGGGIVGFSDLEHDGHLDMMFVHPGWQGMGIASALLARVEEQARAFKLKLIHAEASITARPFFERRGFVVVRPILIEQGGQTFDLSAVEKAILPSA